MFRNYMATLYYFFNDNYDYQCRDYELALTCTEKKAFYGYHSALQTTDDDPPGKLWNKILGLTGICEAYISKRDIDIQWIILHGALASCRRLK